MMLINEVPGNVKKPYCYKTVDSKGKLVNYSEWFKLKKDILKWHQKFGKGLEKMFDRKLVLVKNIPFKKLKNVA